MKVVRASLGCLQGIAELIFMAFLERADVSGAQRELVLEHLESVSGLFALSLKCANTVVYQLYLG
jgi:hypothetical protein